MHTRLMRLAGRPLPSPVVTAVSGCQARVARPWLVVALLLCGLMHADMAASQPTWTSIGPDGGAGIFAIDPRNPATLYVGTDGGLFKSTDGANRWRRLGSLPACCGVTALAIDPTNSATLYVVQGENGGLYKSADGGGSWVQLRQYSYTTALAIDPLTPTTLYSAGQYGVEKSTNGGTTWAYVNNGLTLPYYVGRVALAIDPRTPSTVYLGAANGVFQSTDGGASWVGIFEMFTTNILVIDPLTPTTLYAGSYWYGSSGALATSTDAGGTWTRLPDVRGLLTMAIDPTTPTTLYAGTEDGVRVSTDGGNNWTDAGLTNRRVPDLAVDPMTPTTLYAGTTKSQPSPSGVFRSTNSGQNWTLAETGLTNTRIVTLAIDPTTPTTIYAGSNDSSGAFKSLDGGESWTAMNTGGDLAGLLIDPVTPTTLYAIARHDVIKSTDGGASWAAASPLGSNVFSLAMAPTSPATLYAGMLGSGGVWNSTDGGGNWTPINSDPIFDTVTMLTVDPMTPTTVYGVFGTASPALFKSIDGGAHWRRLLDQNVTALAVDPRTPTTLYVCTQATVDMLKSVNGGESWTAVTTGLPEGIGGTALVFDPATPTTLYVAMGRAGVFTSTDGGNHWSGVNNNGLSGTVAGTLAIAAPSKLYLGTLGTGVFRLF